MTSGHCTGAAIAEPVAEAVADRAAAAAPAKPSRAATVAPATNGHRIRVSPLASKLAEELGVDLATIEGSGPHGAISRDDVEAAAEAVRRPRASARPEPT